MGKDKENEVNVLVMIKPKHAFEDLEWAGIPPNLGKGEKVLEYFEKWLGKYCKEFKKEKYVGVSSVPQKAIEMLYERIRKEKPEIYKKVVEDYSEKPAIFAVYKIKGLKKSIDDIKKCVRKGYGFSKLNNAIHATKGDNFEEELSVLENIIKKKKLK